MIYCFDLLCYESRERKLLNWLDKAWKSTNWKQWEPVWPSIVDKHKYLQGIKRIQSTFVSMKLFVFHLALGLFVDQTIGVHMQTNACTTDDPVFIFWIYYFLLTPIMLEKAKRIRSHFDLEWTRLQTHTSYLDSNIYILHASIAPSRWFIEMNGIAA